jgi:hypothetical protein
MAAANATAPAVTGTTDEAVLSRVPIVIDLGKRSRKKVRRLRRGKGPLLREAGEVIADLQESGRIDGDAQVVVLVVQKKRKGSKRFLRGLL